MVEVFFKNPACGNRIESVIGSYEIGRAHV